MRLAKPWTGLRRREPACRAPFGSLYFDQFGGVRACCANTGELLGDIRTQTIREIWDGGQVERLRAALGRNDYSRGCELCDWQRDHAGSSRTMARSFDELSLAPVDRTWPQKMEFSLSNVCNLQCVMCNGDLSSSIRAHREHLPPIPKVYGPAFFDQLVEFLPHLRSARFIGGEPLLARESLRVLELIARHAPWVPVTLTTNGMIWTDRLEAMLGPLTLSFNVSLDGVTAGTFERIRVGASLDTVLANLDRFVAISRRSGGQVAIGHCLMVDNWFEFGDLLELAERRGIGCFVNTVVLPVEQSLYSLPVTELQAVVEELSRRERHLQLRELRPVWDGQMAMLRSHLRLLSARDGEAHADPWRGEHRIQPGSGAAARATAVAAPRRRTPPDP